MQYELNYIIFGAEILAIFVCEFLFILFLCLGWASHEECSCSQFNCGIFEKRPHIHQQQKVNKSLFIHQIIQYVTYIHMVAPPSQGVVD